MKALSIRQPWAWMIIHAGKDVENRRWRTNYRGPILVHAAKGMTQAEYEDACEYAETNCGVLVPPMGSLQRGGIIGATEIVDCVEESDSPWFFGPYGFVLQKSKPLPFVGVKGHLGLFNLDIGIYYS